MSFADSTSISVKGYWLNPGFASAALLIAVPVGPLEGRLAQLASARGALKTSTAPRNDPLRCGTQNIPIE
jgi:hypothetical protein